VNIDSIDDYTTFRCRPGHLLVAPDPDVIRKGIIWFSDNMHKKAETGICVQHDPDLLDEDLTGKRVLVEKWAWKRIVLNQTTFYIVGERSVFAVLEEGNPAQSDRRKEAKDGNT
jgi:co-chaperonin GroES (HSP10)